ncbi:DUF1998 domain-containing protein [Frigidibacter albus]|uniref:DUF1998 domain-containing protein n=1 Tax=Frigidibacter albus TaxID=1465486 RepID=A0A6L8VLN9_9RHOB|nr:DUF1998 domain-containing protein [Frigidibacter albus]MZQ91278.1 DUF1998 domain-containing protein [Frigidibacter albus]NBE33206.1 DUF1998 domain-containing protein [Frigidibacter albus]GGH63805.1 hypothetical protein GCM10011341_39230 [Frigidibacter albus]
MTGIGKIRRSQVIGTYGPGAIIDFRSPEGAPISAVSGGLELWEEARLDNRQRIHEVRLQASLKVDFFHQPPVGKYKTGHRDAKGFAIEEDRELPAVRFPEWCFCPSCDRLKHARDWAREVGKPDRWCQVCSGQKGKPRRQFVVPVRLVVACEAGHLDEFPWDRWVGHKEGCKRHDLKLVGEAAGLAGLVVKCDGCGAEQSLAKAYGPHALERIGHACSGRRPWLPLAHREACSHPAAVIQRGASNAWFPIVESAIDIPPFSDEFTQFVRQDQYWKAFKALSDPAHIRGAIIDAELMEEWTGLPMTLREMEAQIRRIFERDQQGPETDLRAEEYARLVAPPTQGTADRNFKIEAEAIPSALAGLVGHLVRVERLREVRVLTGFTRLTPKGQEKRAREAAKLYAGKKNWLPAIEVFGEGIFVALDLGRLREWEARAPVRARVAALNVQLEVAAKSRGGTPVVPWPLSARLVLIHTLCHAVIERLSLDCGYSSSSVRERLYAGPEGSDMAGFLIYTSAPGADGTLGGLSREGRAERFGPTLIKAIADTRWCSSDPLCSDGLAALFDSGNHAACHACAFLPETACEHFNQYLDRALVTGTPEDQSIGPDGSQPLAFFPSGY